MAKTIEDFKIGQKAEFSHKVTSEDINKFVDITGDDNLLHVDREYASQTSFKGVVAHGMLSASFISTLVGKHLPGDGALWVSQNLNFLLPVRPNDELTIRAEIVKINLPQKSMTLKTEILNQHRQIVLDGEGVVKVLEIPKQTPRKVSSETPVVLVTGASRGIGAATALHLAKAGYQVVVNYATDTASAEELAKQISKADGQVLLCKADISQPAQVDAMFKMIHSKFGPLTALVNNASPKLITIPFENIAWQEFELQIDIQIKGSFLCTQQAIQDFLKIGAGRIVNVCSTMSDAPTSGHASYTTAKSAMIGFTRSLAVEYGPKNIRVNAVAPGMTDTQMISEIPERARLLAAAKAPLRRLAEPSDIAESIAFLLSDQARHITGEVIRVCGGEVML